MDEKLSLRYQLLSAWCGPAFLLTFIVFWGIVGTNLPAPVSPALNPHDVAVRYLGSWTQMRIGFGISLITVVLYLPWTALLTVQMARIEGRFPVLSLLQLLGGGLTVLVVSLSAVFWAVAAFRPERDPSRCSCSMISVGSALICNMPARRCRCMLLPRSVWRISAQRACSRAGCAG